MGAITDHDEPRLRAEVFDLRGERNFADVSAQYDPPGLAAFDEDPTAAPAKDDEFCCARCS